MSGGVTLLFNIFFDKLIEFVLCTKLFSNAIRILANDCGVDAVIGDRTVGVIDFIVGVIVIDFVAFRFNKISFRSVLGRLFNRGGTGGSTSGDVSKLHELFDAEILFTLISFVGSTRSSNRNSELDVFFV